MVGGGGILLEKKQMCRKKYEKEERKKENIALKTGKNASFFNGLQLDWEYQCMSSFDDILLT